MLIKTQYFTMTDIGLNAVKIAEFLDKGTYKDELAQALCLKYKYNWAIKEEAVIIDEDASDLTPGTQNVEKWINHLKSIYELTRPRYETLMTLYNGNINNLLNKIKSTTLNKFNDTPQTSGDYSGDDYTSTVNKTETEVDPGELMDRLNNIYRKLANIMADWVAEFSLIFGEDI